MENRNGLWEKTRVTRADGTAERDAPLRMAKKIAGFKRLTLAPGKTCGTGDFVRQLRRMNVTPLKT